MAGAGISALIARSGGGDDDLDPPPNEIPAPVPGLPFVAHGPGIAVAVTQVRAYSTGLEISVEVRFNAQDTPAEALVELNRLMRDVRDPGPERLHLALRRTDGAGAQNNRPEGPHQPVPAASPMLIQDASSRGPAWRLAYWARLRPDSGAALSVQWPAQGVQIATVDLAAADVTQAAARIQRLWPPQEP